MAGIDFPVDESFPNSQQFVLSSGPKICSVVVGASSLSFSRDKPNRGMKVVGEATSPYIVHRNIGLLASSTTALIVLKCPLDTSAQKER